MTFTLDLVVNTELTAQLLTFGAGIRILSPESLANHLRDIYRQAAEKYKLRRHWGRKEAPPPTTKTILELAKCTRICSCRAMSASEDDIVLVQNVMIGVDMPNQVAVSALRSTSGMIASASLSLTRKPMYSGMVSTSPSRPTLYCHNFIALLI